MVSKAAIAFLYIWDLIMISNMGMYSVDIYITWTSITVTVAIFIKFPHTIIFKDYDFLPIRSFKYQAISFLKPYIASLVNTTNM